ncbi:MAG: hypothetical protein COY81_05280 [Candidatus Pacebacteria bacterium CG_4_10_14_0_8_um_filter_43_12]|nr:MAG: hypothetical protein COY81_05280 [Candidatus Pacebacteria bacterium CG_4_10_14_0_8_um_filter_43_12]
MHMLNRKAFQSQSGQVAVVVFLIMAVMLVVGLSLASRTSQEIELAGQQEDTTRVFNAAETGIEEALSEPSNFQGGNVGATDISSLPPETTGQYSVTAESGFKSKIDSGETATIFINPAVTGSIDINWGVSGAACSDLAVLVITTYTKIGTTYEATHIGVRPDSCHSGTNFQNVTINGVSDGTITYAKKYQLAIAAGTEMVRIKPLIASTDIFIPTSSVLASQLYTVRSEAQDTSSGNTEVRAIQVTRTKPAPPAILDYALYSGGTLSK